MLMSFLDRTLRTSKTLKLLSFLEKLELRKKREGAIRITEWAQYEKLFLLRGFEKSAKVLSRVLNGESEMDGWVGGC